MSLSKRSRPSPAIIVAALALVVALGGTAIAAPEFAIQKISKSKVKKIAKKQAKKQIRKKAPGLSVDHAKTADKATEADHATNANHANTANTASPTGNAGGDLAGSYPNPLIGDGKVSTDKIAANAVGASEVAPNAIGASALTTIVTRESTISIGSGASGFDTVSCGAGEQVISGGAIWNGVGGTTNPVRYLVHTFMSGNGWGARGTNLTGSAQNFTIEAYCLSP